MVCSHQATGAPAVANTRSRPTLYGCSSRRSLTGHLNSGVDGVFEAVRVVGRGLVSIAEVHAKVARAHLAQSEPEMARDRFGFLERHGFVNCSVGALQHLTLGRRSTPRVQTNCVKCEVVDSERRFICVPTRPKGWADGQAASQAIAGGTTMLCWDFRAPRKNDPLLPDAGDVEKQSCLRRYK